ncbi:hypothetical protein AVEN_118053-1, partial [Araneus ventricosus]
MQNLPIDIDQFRASRTSHSLKSSLTTKTNILSSPFLADRVGDLRKATFAEELDSSDNSDKYAIDGTVIPPDVITPEWLLSTKVLVNGGERLGFL